jgi:uncharacterized Zn-finger protein
MSEKQTHLHGDLPPTGVPGVPETETVETLRVHCDGQMTHPRVWLQIPEDRGWVECGYCDKRFVLAPGAGH